MVYHEARGAGLHRAFRPSRAAQRSKRQASAYSAALVRGSDGTFMNFYAASGAWQRNTSACPA